MCLGADGGPSRCFSLGAEDQEQFAFFLAPSCFPFLWERARHSFTCSHTPFPNIFNTSPSVALLSSFPSLFFFFAPPPSSSFSAPRRLLGPALLAVHSLCFSRSSTTFLYPPLPPNYQPARLPAPRLLEVTWDRIDRRLITFDRIDFFRRLV